MIRHETRFWPFLDSENRPLYSYEQIQDYLDTIGGNLDYWYGCRMDEDVSIRRRRAGVLDETGKMLKDLIDQSGVLGYSPQLLPPLYDDKVKEQMIIHYPNDILVLTTGGLYPKQPHEDEKFPGEFYGPEVWRFGDNSRLVPLDEIARLLSDGGYLSLAETPAGSLSDPTLPPAA